MSLFDRPRSRSTSSAPLGPEDRAMLERGVPSVVELADGDRRELEQLTAVFLREKAFEGCGGLEVTRDMMVTIAGQACRLLLRRGAEVFPEVDTVLVYPGAYRPPAEENEDGIVVDSDDEWVGESWDRGVVVLAWDEVLTASSRPLDGHNVVLHEFAHQLDAEDGAMNGAPDLGSLARFESWARVLGEEMEELTRRLEAGRRSVLDAYGATSPAEFFAVVTETFFEKPRTLRRRHPALYAELAAFYEQDPAGS